MVETRGYVREDLDAHASNESEALAMLAMQRGTFETVRDSDDAIDDEDDASAPKNRGNVVAQLGFTLHAGVTKDPVQERYIDQLAALSALGERTGFNRSASARRLEELERSGASDCAVATARLQHDSLERLAELRAADARALDELADLLEALRTQLVLARYEGSPADDASAIVSEVWARLEARARSTTGCAGALAQGASSDDLTGVLGLSGAERSRAAAATRIARRASPTIVFTADEMARARR